MRRSWRVLRLDLDHCFDLDRAVERKGSHAAFRERRATDLADHFHKQVRRPLRDEVMLSEVGYGVDEDQEPHEPGDLRELAQLRFQAPEDVHRRHLGLFPCFHGELGPELAVVHSAGLADLAASRSFRRSSTRSGY